MVDIAEVVEEAAEQQQETVPASQERLWDAEEIEAAAKNLKRVSARLHLEALAKKLRKESDALRRMEKSAAVAAANTSAPSNGDAATAPIADEAPSPSPSAAAPTPIPPLSSPTAPPTLTGNKYTPIDRFSFDFGGYNSAFVTLYIPLPGVGAIPKEQVSCQFTKESFDLIVRDLQSNKSYRLFKDHLEKDIDPEKSKYIIKADKIVVKLAKKKGEYGSYDFWSKLTDPKKGTNKKTGKDNPQASIMELMKDMYNEGNDDMKKVIGETFMKQQRGELGKDGPGGLGGLGDIKLEDDF